MLIALLAGVAMFFKDSLDALIVVAESRGHGKLAGLIDIFKWYAEITTAVIAVTNIFERGIVKSIPIIVCVSIGNFLGRYLGTYVGCRFIKVEK